MFIKRIILKYFVARKEYDELVCQFNQLKKQYENLCILYERMDVKLTDSIKLQVSSESMKV